MQYAGRPLGEIVLWRSESVVEMPAWRVKMKLVTESGETDPLINQG
jgi:hypothetical protein